MPTTIQVFGTATMAVDSSTLGVGTADGWSVKITQHTKDVYTDERGEAIPADIIGLGQEATVTGELARFDIAVLRTFIQKRSSAGTYGTMGTIGELMINSSRTSVVTLVGAISGLTYTFNRAYLLDDVAFDNLSVSSNTTVPITLRCLPDASGVIFTVA